MSVVDAKVLARANAAAVARVAETGNRPIVSAVLVAYMDGETGEQIGLTCNLGCESGAFPPGFQLWLADSLTQHLRAELTAYARGEVPFPAPTASGGH